jgi:hypothetical protein
LLRHSNNTRTLSFDLLYRTGGPAAIDVHLLTLRCRSLKTLPLFVPLRLSIHLRQLSLHLRALLTLRLSVPLRHLPLHLRKLPLDWCLSLDLRELPLRLSVHLRSLALHLWHRSLHLRHLPLHLRRGPLGPLPHLRLRARQLLRRLPLHLRLAASCATFVSAATVAFTLRRNITEAADSQRQ